MEIKTTTLTSIKLSAKDIKEIVIEHFKNKGFTVEQYSEHIKTVYDGGIGDYGTEEFDGVSIIANKKEENIKL